MSSQRKEELYRAHTNLDTLKVKNKQLSEEYMRWIQNPFLKHFLEFHYIRNQKSLVDIEHRIFAYQHSSRTSVSAPAKKHDEEIATFEALNLGKAMRQTQQMDKYLGIKTEYEER